jgi:hypothetical protein
MSPSTPSRHWTALVVVGAFAVLAPVLRKTEVKRYLNPTIEEIARRNNLDPAAQARLRATLRSGLLPADGRVSVISAENSVARALRQNQFWLADDGGRGRLKVLLKRPSGDHDQQTIARLSRTFVDSVFSDVRRRSILAEIGPGPSEELGRSQLRERLKGELKVADFEDVTASFDHLTAPVVAKTLEEDTTMLRVYGGTSKAIGRYLFCCRWSAEKAFGEATSWSDASGLATPPGNQKRRLALVTLPAGTTVFVGVVADNFANALGVKAKGGNTQIFVPNVNPASVQKFRLADGRLPTDIVIVGEDRILRFRPFAHTGN